MQLELAPYLNRIISPPLRPVNSQVIRPAERALLARLVGVMANLELRFVQEKTEEGQLVYRLDPPIDVFVTYDGRRAADIAISRYAVRHLVAAEVRITVASGICIWQNGRSDTAVTGADGDGVCSDRCAGHRPAGGGPREEQEWQVRVLRPGVSDLSLRGHAPPCIVRRPANHLISSLLARSSKHDASTDDGQPVAKRQRQEDKLAEKVRAVCDVS